MAVGKKHALLCGTLGLGCVLLLGGGSTLAADCKGLERKACEGNTSCSWVKPYVRKDGVKVSGYCKSKPKRSSKSGEKKSSKSE